MKELQRVARVLYAEPWGILPEVHASLCEQFEAYLAREEKEPMREALVAGCVQGKADDPVGPTYRGMDGRMGFWHEQVVVQGRTAVLRVSGILGKHLSTLAMWCGGVDMGLIAKQAGNIAADASIENVVLWIDSPGGTCAGALETAQAIEAMSAAGKETVAYTDTQAASCGYFLAAGCDAIMASPSAIVGSISVFSAYLDESRRYEAEGKERLLFRSGNVKGMGVPGKAWTDEEKAFAQQVVDQYADQFKGFVARRRKGVGDAEMQGNYWPASHAPRGLVDGIVADVETLVRRLNG